MNGREDLLPHFKVLSFLFLNELQDYAFMSFSNIEKSFIIVINKRFMLRNEGVYLWERDRNGTWSMKFKPTGLDC
ncbi:hypothetical protein GCM10008986_23600 [Salinibacillus aidingensis]|uniref:Uncharacterized protein n=1 Tax=Salinibacillus aidingensis TaxID=237684 RepID=A0ABN1BEK8_9BACI